jgi:RimJ/RimL family protein N-acetyltransferase
MIKLVAMSAEEFQTFLGWSIPDYAEAHVKAGRWNPNDAVERSKAEHAQLLPNGVETPDNYLRTVYDDALGRQVGEVWYALQKQDGWPQLFVYWIGIGKEFRQRGYATEVFRLLEAEAKRLGAARIALHVFGDNVGARALYEKLGYVTTNIVMAKDVRP